jgi:hypothetical protein
MVIQKSFKYFDLYTELNWQHFREEYDELINTKF